MKRVIFCISAILFFCLLFSCDNGSSDSSGSSSTTTATISHPGTGGAATTGTDGTASTTSGTTATTAASWSYSASSPVFDAGTDILSVTISGLNGQTIYLAKINPTETKISSSNTRYVSATTGLSSDVSTSTTTTGVIGVGPGIPVPFGGPQGAGRSCAQIDEDELSGVSVSDVSGAKHFIPPQSFGGKETCVFEQSDSAERSVSVPLLSVTQITPVAGTTTKSVYVDQDSDISTFAAKTATCEAVGTYCYVWIVNDYLSDTASGNKVNAAVAEAYAEKFDAMYPLIRNVFGEESDKIYYGYSSSSGWSESDMNVLSDTGTKVNIVIYDIGGGDSSGGSIVGYFYAKDYYPNQSSMKSANGISYSSGDARIYSNEGKYFYVDSYFANSYLDTTYSTLAHEFQHMIDWNTKTMEQSLSPSTWYNEMLSMLSEDMMQNSLGIDDDDSPKGRLPAFNKYYRYVGLEYNSSTTSYTVISYANAYAFGCWCVRQFGGAALVQKMSENAYVDTDSVLNAVNTLNSTSYTMADILKMYAQACVFNSASLKASYVFPTFNQNAAQTLAYSAASYSYPMTAVDLWDSAYDWTTSTGGYSSSKTAYSGPALYGCTSSYLYDLRPYGFTLHTVGIASSSSVTITFSSTGSSDEDMYLFIQ